MRLTTGLTCTTFLSRGCGWVRGLVACILYCYMAFGFCYTSGVLKMSVGEGGRQTDEVCAGRGRQTDICSVGEHGRQTDAGGTSSSSPSRMSRRSCTFEREPLLTLDGFTSGASHKRGVVPLNNFDKDDDDDAYHRNNGDQISHRTSQDPE